MLESVIVTFSVLFYIVGGNSINDSVDAEVDRIAHPGRPVPSGRISQGSAFRFGLSSLAIAFLLSVATMDVTVIAEADGVASIQEDLSYYQLAYMEDRPLRDGADVMEYAQ